MSTEAPAGTSPITPPSQAPSLRLEIVGPEIPEHPFPIYVSGAVQAGFGRGSKELGIPTANLNDEALIPMTSVLMTGVYFGFAQVRPPPDSVFKDIDKLVHPMVMSLGWNPFYKNESMTGEIHIIHEFPSDFYGYEMGAVVLGHIRPELDYLSKEALIEDIQMDKRVALKSLARPGYQRFVVELSGNDFEKANRV